MSSEDDIGDLRSYSSDESDTFDDGDRNDGGDKAVVDGGLIVSNGNASCRLFSGIVFSVSFFPK